MRIYMAPMEGMTGYIFRNAYEKYFGGVDKYFTPFISSTGLSHKERNDILPEHNEGLYVVPQILTNRAEEFLIIAEKLEQMGYEEINLNLGCPSGTVVAKGRGAGFLARTEELDEFLEEIFRECKQKISIKTRVGMESEEEWEELLQIYNQYPVYELIVHPRVQKDFYKGPIRRNAFTLAMEHSKAPLCYNGEIHTKEAYDKMRLDFPKVDTCMLGRGIFKNPFLIEEIREKGEKETQKLREFHDEVLIGYERIMSGDKNTLFKMKEIWSYLGEEFSDKQKALKKLRKANSLAEYKAIVNEIFRL